MSRFKRIKNKSNKKSSDSINEKIAALNKELEKTGMLSEITMTTSNVYSTSTFVPAYPGETIPIPDTSGVTGSGFVQPVSGDPNDSSNWPNAYTDNSWMRNPNTVNGEANQPIVASFDDALFATDTSGRYPTGGAGIVYGNQGFGVSVGYIRNGFYHQVLKPGLLGGTVTVPQNADGAPYFGLFGEYFPADETRQAILKSASARYGAVNVAGATTIPVKAWTPHNNFHMGSFDSYSGPKVTVGGQNYVLQTFQMFTKSNSYTLEPRPATTTNPIFRGIGDINYHGPITPGKLFGLSDQGFNFLKGKASSIATGAGAYDGMYDLDGRGWFVTGDQLLKMQKNPEKFNLSPAQTRRIRRMKVQAPSDGTLIATTDLSSLYPKEPITDPTTTTQTQQSPPEDTEPPNIPAPESPPDKPFTTPNPTPPPDIPPLPAPKPQPGNYEGRGGRILDPTGLDSRGVELGYNDELYPVNPNRYYTTQVDLSQDILSSLMNAEFYSAASRGESPNYNNAEINKAKADVAKARENLDNWNRWKQNTGYTWRGAVSDSEYDKQKALEKELNDKELDKQIDQLEKDKAQAEADAEAAATEARNLIAKFGLDVALTLFGPGILKLAGNALGKLPVVAKFFKLSKSAQAAKIGKTFDKAINAADDGDELYNLVRKATQPELSRKIASQSADDFIDFVNSDLMGRNIERAIKAGEKIIILPFKGKKVPISVDKVQQFRFKGPNYQQLFQSHKPEGKVLSEATKLGHFEPEELNVDIEKLRKGVMPEHPKKPPAKMVDGYHQDSQLKPKKLNKEPYLKIGEKELIRNHRLKPSEAQEMMQTINLINNHIKKHPEDLIHAQMRYPIDDPRLAELNWRMDQMLDAGEKYLDSNFKVNDKLFKRAVDRTKKNIKLTDPEYVQQHYDELRGTPKPKKTKLVGRLGKHLNKYESKSLFKHVDSQDFKKISERKEEQKRLQLEKETALNDLTKIRQEYIEDELLKQKFDWRKDIFETNKDIKPEFPKNPPPKLDPKTGMHPQYGKRADRYTKLDPISADSMPLTGDPETDAIVKKQKNKKNFKEWSQQLDSMWKSDWRDELEEGMTTADTFVTVSPGQGDTDLITTGTGYQDGIHQLQNIPPMETVDDPHLVGKALGGGAIGAGYNNVYGGINQYTGPSQEADGIENTYWNNAVDGSTLDNNTNPRYSDYIYPFDREATATEIQTAKDASQVRGRGDVFRATYPTNVFANRHKATPVATNPTVGVDDAYETAGLGVRYGAAYDNRTPRFFVPASVNASEIDTVKILASVDTDNYGNAKMNQAGSQLQLYYWAGDKPGFQSLQNKFSHPSSDYPNSNRQYDGWRPIAQKPNGEIDNSVSSNIIDIIKPDGFLAGKVSEFTLQIPEWCRTTNTRFMFLQMSSSNGGPTIYSIRYQRRNALTINTTLEDDISSAYVRAGMDSHLTSAERKKKLEERLRASREYMIKSLGFADLFKDEVKISDVASSSFDFISVMQGSGAYGNTRFNDLVSLEKRQAAAAKYRPRPKAPTKSRSRKFRGYKVTGKDSKGMTTRARVNPNDVWGSI